jgi:hypothetical protein
MQTAGRARSLARYERTADNREVTRSNRVGPISEDSPISIRGIKMKPLRSQFQDHVINIC